MRILIIDDHPVFREGLAAILSGLGDGTDVIQASDARQGLDITRSDARIGIAVLDLMMPGMSGLSAVSELKHHRPDLPVIILSSSEDIEDAKRAFSLGASGYVPKSASAHVLLSAIRIVHEGDRFVPPMLLTALTDAPQPSRPNSVAPALAPLTERQLDVLRRLANGDTNRKIADDLDLSEKTVKTHVGAIFRSLNVVNRTQAAQAGRAAGMI